ncbi:MAG: peptidoglycan-binding domain-containing protein [Patescibacteria group bacterium]
MNLKNLLVVGTLALAFILSPVVTHAQTFNIADLNAIIADLSRQLMILQSQQNQNTGAWCHTFNINLRIEMIDGEVSALQTALVNEGFVVNERGGINYYGDSMASAVSGFQEKYRGQILTPNNLPRGTGYFGPATRAVMNRLYSCNKNRDGIDRTLLNNESQSDDHNPIAYYTITTSTAGTGSGTITRSPNQTSYPAGTVVRLTANPASGSTFSDWDGNCSGPNDCVLTMNSNKSATANFNQ